MWRELANLVLLVSCLLFVIGVLVPTLLILGIPLAILSYSRLWVPFNDSIMSFYAAGLSGLLQFFCPGHFYITFPPKSSIHSSTLSQIRSILRGVTSSSKNYTDTEEFQKGQHIVICNHQIDADSFYLLAFLSRLGLASRARFILKRSLMFIPFLGLQLKFAGNVFVRRDWQTDSLKMPRRIRRLADPETSLLKLLLHSSPAEELGNYTKPYSLIMFPEGTFYDPRTYEKSNTYASQHDIPPTLRVLIPRVRGLFLAARELSRINALTGIIDITCAYASASKTYEHLRAMRQDPSAELSPIRIFLLAASSGLAPLHVHMHVNYISVEEIRPHLDNIDDFSAWLLMRYRDKDALMQYFDRHQHFPKDLCRNRLILPIGSRSAVYMILILSAIGLFINYTWIKWILSSHLIH